MSQTQSLPRVGDTVRVGRHGQPMTVMTVHPISGIVVVENPRGVRFHVEVGELIR